MSAPRWARALLARLAGPDLADEVVGDLEEAHRIRVERRGRVVATLLTSVEALDMALALRWRRRLLRRFRGNVPEDLPAAKRRPMPPVSWLDFKLGLRMLLKHPGLSFVSTLGIAVGVAIGAGTFGVIRGITASPLPLPEGDRIVTIQNTSELGFEQERQTHLHDLPTWREQLTALEEIGAYRIVTRNLIGEDGSVAPARVVQMTASGFRIARVPPLLGRYLVDDDEEPGARPVIVIGRGVWRDLFGGSADVLGRSLRVGAVEHTVVGVMPRDFAFPINNRMWIPFRLDPDDFAPGSAPEIDTFGRLAPRSSIDELAAQLAVVGRRAATASPATHEGVTPRAFPYTQELVWGPMSWVLYLISLIASMVLVVIAINVAALVYARTVARTSEIVVRTALGASRGRIAGQLFAEALVLSGIAAGAGLLTARYGLHRLGLWWRATSDAEIPFWWSFDVSPTAAAYALGLAVLAAVIIGVAPALGATGRGLGRRLQRAGAGASGAGPGRLWTTLIVLQLAGAVAILPVTFSGVVSAWVETAPSGPPPFPLDEVLVGRLELDVDGGNGGRDGDLPSNDRFAALQADAVERVESLPEVSRVALWRGRAPWSDPDVPFELSEGPSVVARPAPPGSLQSAATGGLVGRSSIPPEVFDIFDIPVLRGRALDARDAVAEPNTAVVSEVFVDRVLGGANPLGRRIRFPRGDEPTSWYTIVGVIPHFPSSGPGGYREAKVYLPAVEPEDGAVNVAIRMRASDASAFAGRLRREVADIDPMLRFALLGTLETGSGPGLGSFSLVAVVVALAAAVLLLAVAGLYAMMSFTVERRHREIGIRTALGAEPRRVVTAILSRAAWQLTLGVLLGLAFADLADRMAGGEMLRGRQAALLPAVALLMVAVGLAAAWGPTRRALGVEPTDVLKAE